MRQLWIETNSGIFANNKIALFTKLQTDNLKYYYKTCLPKLIQNLILKGTNELLIFLNLLVLHVKFGDAI